MFRVLLLLGCLSIVIGINSNLFSKESKKITAAPAYINKNYTQKKVRHVYYIMYIVCTMRQCV